MEFTLDCENVQVRLKDDKCRYISCNSPIQESNFAEFDSKGFGSPISNASDPFEISETTLLRYEIFLKLDDYYLINNIKILGEIEEFNINKIKFQNVNTGLWENVTFYNPDNYKEIKIQATDNLSIFSVGLTKYIKIELSMNLENEIFSNRTLGTPYYDSKNIINNDMNMNIKNNNCHNKSMRENVSTNLKKKSHLNLNMNKVNSLIGNISHDMDIELREQHVEQEKPHNTQNHIKEVIKKITIFSQYIYSIPNSTFLLTLLNLKNFFYNNYNKQFNSYQENYISSLFLTATSMIGARLFIQAWELFNKIQIFIMKNLSPQNFNFFKILLEPNQLVNYMTTSDNNDSRISTFLTKLEIIKSICMFEQGHIIGFLESLKNSIDIYFLNDFSGIKMNVSWVKNNEIGSDKFYIQNFLNEKGKNLSEILILLLKDQSEIIKYSSLKIIEFILDYNQFVLTNKYSTILKNIIKSIYDVYLENILAKTDKTNYIESLYNKYNNIFKKDLSNLLSNDKTINKQQIQNTQHTQLSPLLMKQLNYTFDTLINNIDNIPNHELQLISEKILFLVFNILKKIPQDSVLAINLFKLFRKLFDNLNISLLDTFTKWNPKYTNNISSEEFIFDLIILSINNCFINQFKEYFSHFQNNTKKIIPTLSNIISDNSEIGCLISYIFDKIHDDLFIFRDREYSVELLKWIINNLNVNMSLLEESNDQEFVIFHTYILLSICQQFFFDKSELKCDINKIFLHKIHPQFFKLIDSLVSTLLDYEELCIKNKKFIIIFDCVINCLKKIQQTFMKNIKINFLQYFKPKYTNLNSFIENYGIFNENIFYLTKTLPLIQETDEVFIDTLSNILKVVLNNFSNHYNEDLFELFCLLLNKLKLNINQDIIDGIINAIVSKYNYKGNSFTVCCDKFFSLILEHDKIEYFIYFRNNLINSLEKYVLMFSSEKDILKNKEVYLELLEKFELLKKYLQYLKNEKNLNLFLTKESDLINQKLTLLFFGQLENAQNNFKELLLKMVRFNDNTVTIKLFKLDFDEFLRSYCGKL